MFPDTREQRCWWHKIGDVLPALPKSAHPGAKKALAEIYNAEDREHAEATAKAFADVYGAKWPKVAAKITEDLDVLLAFYDYPAEHWIHLAPPTRSSPPSPPSDCGSGSPRDPALVPPVSRWRSSSSSPPNAAGAPSTHPTWSRSSAPGHGSTRASLSNDPTTTNQHVIGKSRDTTGCEMVDSR